VSEPPVPAILGLDERRSTVTVERRKGWSGIYLPHVTKANFVIVGA